MSGALNGAVGASQVPLGPWGRLSRQGLAYHPPTMIETRANQVRHDREEGGSSHKRCSSTVRRPTSTRASTIPRGSYSPQSGVRQNGIDYEDALQSLTALLTEHANDAEFDVGAEDRAVIARRELRDWIKHGLVVER